MDKVFFKLWVHFVWGTKDREPILTNRILFKVCEHIKQSHDDKKFFVDTVNGWHDHLHCLVSFKPSNSVSSIIQVIKGESSHWIDETGLIDGGLIWQGGYAAFSVSESQVEKVRGYIVNQRKHHERMSFQNEVEALNRLHR